MKTNINVKKNRRDSFVESSTYIAFMDGLPEYSKLYFKIGKSINYKERLRQLQTSNPFIKTILLQGFDCEYFLHSYLKKYKVKNEWFCINEASTVKEVAIIIRPLIIDFVKLNK
jgi:hypothetical protein